MSSNFEFILIGPLIQLNKLKNNYSKDNSLEKSLSRNSEQFTQVGKKRWVLKFLRAKARAKVPMKRMSESMNTSDIDLETKFFWQSAPSRAQPLLRQAPSSMESVPMASTLSLKKAVWLLFRMLEEGCNIGHHCRTSIKIIIRQWFLALFLSQ